MGKGVQKREHKEKRNERRIEKDQTDRSKRTTEERDDSKKNHMDKQRDRVKKRASPQSTHRFHIHLEKYEKICKICKSRDTLKKVSINFKL